MKFTLLLILFIFSCNTSQNYKVTGVVKEIHNDKRKLLIDHEEIPGFMVKMDMFFNIVFVIGICIDFLSILDLKNYNFEND